MPDAKTDSTQQDGDESGRIRTLSEIQAEQETQRDKIDQILGILSGDHGDAQAHTEQRLDAPSAVADMVRRQLDERDAAQRQADADKTSQDRIGAIETKLAELAEQPPAEPVKRRHKIMGWT